MTIIAIGAVPGIALTASGILMPEMTWRPLGEAKCRPRGKKQAISSTARPIRAAARLAGVIKARISYQARKTSPSAVAALHGKRELLTGRPPLRRPGRIAGGAII